MGIWEREEKEEKRKRGEGGSTYKNRGDVTSIHGYVSIAVDLGMSILAQQSAE